MEIPQCRPLQFLAETIRLAVDVAAARREDDVIDANGLMELLKLMSPPLRTAAESTRTM